VTVLLNNFSLLIQDIGQMRGIWEKVGMGWGHALLHISMAIAYFLLIVCC